MQLQEQKHKLEWVQWTAFQWLRAQIPRICANWKLLTPDQALHLYLAASPQGTLSFASCRSIVIDGYQEQLLTRSSPSCINCLPPEFQRRSSPSSRISHHKQHNDECRPELEQEVLPVLILLMLIGHSNYPFFRIRFSISHFSSCPKRFPRRECRSRSLDLSLPHMRADRSVQNE
jgi:hypothetical protein